MTELVDPHRYAAALETTRYLRAAIAELPRGTEQCWASSAQHEFQQRLVKLRLQLEELELDVERLSR